MIALISGWVLLAAWSEIRRRPRGRLRNLTRPPAATPCAIRWPEVLRELAARTGLPLPATVGRTARIGAGLAAVAAIVAPHVAVAGALGATVVVMVRRRAQSRARTERLRRGLPETLDLLSLAVRAGLVPSEALAVACERTDDPLDEILGSALMRLRRGAAWGEVVGHLGRDLGPDGRGLELLLAGEGGAPLADGIDRLAAELRDQRRREIQRRAQRLPITVLAPLVSCILPAFLLITIVPVVSTLGGGVIQDLPLGATP